MGVATLNNPAPHVSFDRERGVYTLEVLRGIAHAIVEVGEGPTRNGNILHVLRVLETANVAIFLTKLHRSAVTFALAEAEVDKAENALAEAGLKVKIRTELALTIVRAASMRELFGIMVAIADALYTAGARVYETGDSHNSVQCLIENRRVTEAVQSLCQTFSLESDAVREISFEAEAVA